METKNIFNLLKDEVPDITVEEALLPQERKPEVV